MTTSATDAANVVAAIEVKGAGLPTPTLEKQAAMESKEPFPATFESDDESDLIKPTEEELATLRRVPAKLLLLWRRAKVRMEESALSGRRTSNLDPSPSRRTPRFVLLCCMYV